MNVKQRIGEQEFVALHSFVAGILVCVGVYLILVAAMLR